MQGPVVLQVSYIFGDVMKSLFSQMMLATLIFVSVSVAHADAIKPSDVVPVINGEVYSKIARVEGEEGVTSFQYVRSNEEFKGWTGTVIYANYQLDDIGDDPQNVAIRLVQGLQNLNPGAKYQLVGDESGKVVLLDFLSWPPSRNYMELSVYRIQRDKPGEGVYSLQFSTRMPFITEANEEVTNNLKVLRASLLQQAVQFDMNKVIELLKSE
ncbi:hypothetical protein NBRC116585_29880 [Thalassolituus maritimus]|uniref:Uncharacterized protein n=2 Tax=Thalassolituus maritimus TaxID=484498 RepID=A0ABQ0A3A2_9GAMM